MVYFERKARILWEEFRGPMGLNKNHPLNASRSIPLPINSSNGLVWDAFLSGGERRARVSHLARSGSEIRVCPDHMSNASYLNYITSKLVKLEAAHYHSLISAPASHRCDFRQV